MILPYPRNCQPIVLARANGMRPADPVLVVCTDQYRAHRDSAVVYIDAEQGYRWDWVRGMHIVVLIEAETKLGGTLDAINREEPSQLDVVDVERGLGWLVNFTHPRLSTVRWPDAWARDWLGDGAWHRAHQQYTRQERHIAEARQLDEQRRFA
jgi:hypothetical protein